LQAAQDGAARALEEYVDEHGDEDGLLAGATNDKGTVTKNSVRDRLRAIDREADSDEESEALTHCLSLIEAEATMAKALKELQAALDEKVLATYAKLGEAEIKMLVVEDKWLTTLRVAIDGEVQRLTRGFAGRVKELDERYARPLPDLLLDIETMSAKVDEDLNKIGLTW